MRRTMQRRLIFLLTFAIALSACGRGEKARQRQRPEPPADDAHRQAMLRRRDVEVERERAESLGETAACPSAQDAAEPFRAELPRPCLAAR